MDNAQLSSAARGAIGDRIRECWTRDTGALDYDKMSAHLQITTDAGGVIRDARVTQAGASPAARAFAERAVRAALRRPMRALPLPPS